MSPDAKPAKSTPAAKSQDKDASEPCRALLLELEGAVVNHRSTLLELLRAHAKSGTTIDEVFFARYAVKPSAGHVAAGVAGPLGLKAGGRATLARELHAGLSELYTSPEVKARDGVAALLKEAAEGDMAIGLLSSLPEDEATALVAALALGDVPVRVFCYPAEEAFPGADLWLKMAKALGANARGCTAVVSTAAACRSALAAGMRCVAVPDVFTACHDFSGADRVVDDLSAETPRDLLAAAD